jgi:Protein of unknown function (DUF2000)
MIPYTEELFATAKDVDNRAAANATTPDLALVGIGVVGDRRSVDKLSLTLSRPSPLKRANRSVPEPGHGAPLARARRGVTQTTSSDLGAA